MRQEAPRWAVVLAVVVLVVIIAGLAWVFLRPKRGPETIPGPPPQLRPPGGGIIGGPGQPTPPAPQGR